MNKKLEEIKEKLIGEEFEFGVGNPNFSKEEQEGYKKILEGSFTIGFEAAMDLDLAVKYARWKDTIFKGFIDSKSQPEQGKRINEIFNKLGKFFDEEQLFEYWLTNIFKF